MSFSVSFNDLFSRVYVVNEVLSSASRAALVRNALTGLENIPVHYIDGAEEIPREYLNQRTLVVSMDHGNMLRPCPGSRGQVCCNYLTLNVYGGCTLGCSYCIMKHYLNYQPITVAVNVEDAVKSLTALAEKHPDRIFRAGTGETGDSLLLDPLFRISRRFIEAFAPYGNIRFEVKTKTSFVDHLLGIKGKGNAVIGFSLNPEKLVSEEESGAAPLSERLEAAEKALAAGYLLSFHFDPIIPVRDWEDIYLPLVKNLARFPRDRIAWISMGLLRYPPGLKESMEARPYTGGEFFHGRDGKYRYLQKFRVSVYRKMLAELRTLAGVPVYLCMETPAVWRYVFGGLPQAFGELRPVFSRVRGLHTG